MFTIDLLKGAGLPPKGDARRAVFAGIAAAVPVLAAIALFGFYLNNKIFISIQQREIELYGAKTDKLAAAVARQRALEGRKSACTRSLAEVSAALRRYTQWSGILATIVSSMPESVVLTGLEVRNRPVQKKVPKKEDPKSTTTVTIQVPRLKMRLAALPQGEADKAIKEFRNALLGSRVVGPKLENIAVSQAVDQLEGLDVVMYEMDCLFKAEL